MTKAGTPWLLESDPAPFCGKAGSDIPVVRSVRAISAHPILLARNMTSPLPALTMAACAERTRLLTCSLAEEDGAPGQIASCPVRRRSKRGWVRAAGWYAQTALLTHR